MKALLLSSLSVALLLPGLSLAAGGIFAPGRLGDTKMMTKLPNEVLAASPEWSFDQGEPVLGPAKAASLAMEALRKTFPELKNASVGEVALKEKNGHGYYRVLIMQKVDPKAVTEAGGAMTPSQLGFFVLMDGTVVTPQPKD